MQILNIAGYKFIPLQDLESLKAVFLDECGQRALKGTILLSNEGINLSMAGTVEKMESFKTRLLSDQRFADMTFRESYSQTQPFQRLKVKLKKEIITMRKEEVAPLETRAPSIAPLELKKWLDENRDITILDTRNDYEIRFGTFENAVNLHLNHFSEFPAASQQINKDKPVVMFCTGGIRCEKAALYLMSQGFSDVHQLEGGILNYFAQAGGAHYDGECYVFDERISVDASLKSTGTIQCVVCQGPITVEEQKNSCCPTCHSNKQV